jgi:hypothetical protein
MANADMAEAVEHVLIGEDAAGERAVIAAFGETIGHETKPPVGREHDRFWSKAETRALAK